jgi:hypothetical protein
VRAATTIASSGVTARTSSTGWRDAVRDGRHIPARPSLFVGTDLPLLNITRQVQDRHTVSREEYEMALSDALAAMSAKAKEAEDAFYTAQTAQHAKLEEQVARARASAQEHNDELRQRADRATSEASSWWSDVQQQWDKQAKQMRSNIESKREEQDAKRAAARADMAEDDAAFAIDIARAAIDEAEYATLEAVLRREKANELAAAR